MHTLQYFKNNSVGGGMLAQQVTLLAVLEFRTAVIFLSSDCFAFDLTSY